MIFLCIHCSLLKGRHAFFGSATAWYLATDMPPTWLFQAAVPILACCLQFAVRAFCDAARINTRKKKNGFCVPYCAHCSTACGLLVAVGSAASLGTCLNLHLVHGCLVQADSTHLTVLLTLWQVFVVQAPSVVAMSSPSCPTGQLGNFMTHASSQHVLDQHLQCKHQYC